MKTYFITFRSITYAQRGEKNLNEAGYRCYLRRTPRWMEERGCGYCLQLTVADIRQPVSLLQLEEVPMRKVYVQKENGTMAEVTL